MLRGWILGHRFSRPGRAQRVAATRKGVVGERRGLWPSFAAPGVLWLILLFVVPFYAILAVAMGRLDPIFASAEPVWNPIEWDPSAFGRVWDDIASGPLQDVFIRTLAYVLTASALCLLIGYPVAYYLARYA